MESKPKSELLRLMQKDGSLFPSPEKEDGRGSYICKSEECLEKAIKRKSFQRIIKRALSQEEIDGISASIVELI